MSDKCLLICDSRSLSSDLPRKACKSCWAWISWPLNPRTRHPNNIAVIHQSWNPTKPRMFQISCWRPRTSLVLWLQCLQLAACCTIGLGEIFNFEFGVWRVIHITEPHCTVETADLWMLIVRAQWFKQSSIATARPFPFIERARMCFFFFFWEQWF